MIVSACMTHDFFFPAESSFLENSAALYKKMFKIVTMLPLLCGTILLHCFDE